MYHLVKKGKKKEKRAFRFYYPIEDLVSMQAVFEYPSHTYIQLGWFYSVTLVTEHTKKCMYSFVIGVTMQWLTEVDQGWAAGMLDGVQVAAALLVHDSTIVNLIAVGVNLTEVLRYTAYTDTSLASI